jgi:hypothetical protein
VQKTTGTWVVALLILSSFGFVRFTLAQQSAQFPNLPANIVGPQLVAWSELQKPQPMPQPLPPPERADQSKPNQSQADQSQADHPQDQPVQPPAHDQPSAQAFVGTIVKDGSRFVLKVSTSVVYQIDDQEKARIYEGKQVRVSGNLDAKSNLLHITSIEAVS